MRWHDHYLAATGSCLPAREDPAQAVRDGRYDPDEHELNGYTAVAVSDGDAAADLAVRAARTALADSGHTPADIALTLHAGMYHQGREHWTPASYLQHRVVGGRAPAIEVNQASLGGIAALVLGLCYLNAGPGGPAALISTGDRFCPPVYDRYRTEKWFVWADGGTAAVLSRTAGRARILATALESDPTLEELYRGEGPFTDHPHSGPLPLDLRERKRAYVTRHGFEDIALREATGLRNAVKQALEDAELDQAQIDRYVLPNVGRALLQWQYLDVLGIDVDATSYGWGRGIGHLGAGDQLAGLDHLLRGGTLRPGQRIVLAGSGLGFNWGCAVLEILPQ